MRAIAWIACAAALSAAAAELAAPADWRKESFTFPLVFAPSIPYEGTEHVRFSPAWSHFAQPDGFTYALLWDIKRRTLDPAEIERALDVYFDGLMEAATRAKKIEDPGTVSSVSLHPMATPEGWSTASGGRLFTWNGFSRGEALQLNLEITQRDCGADRSHVLILFSKAPRDQPVWKELRAIRADTSCEAKPA
ncbi:MAG TPA: hypothetical protein VFJ62_20575 [Usitatibacter sp.]|nr:hypothetical protein [Usitatibacter sp.]